MHIDIDTSTKLHISNITNDLFVFLYLFAIRYFLKYKKIILIMEDSKRLVYLINTIQ